MEQPLSTLMQVFPYFKWLAIIVKHFIPWLSTSLFFPQCLCKCSTCYHVWSCHKHHCYPPLPPPDCFCGLWVIWRSMAMQTWSQRWYLEIGLALICPHSRLHWWQYVNFNSTRMSAESLVLPLVQEGYTSYPKTGEEVQEDCSQTFQKWPNQSVVSLVAK